MDFHNTLLTTTSMSCDTDQAHSVYAHTYVSDQSHVHQGNVQNYYLASTFSREQQCHQVLKTSDYESQKDAVPSSSPQTCRWVLDHPDYQHWRKDSGNHIIWISANPGCGKSVLAKLLTDSELPRSHQISICYFFFSIGSQEQENLATALCAILHQLFTSQSHLLCHAVTEWCRAGDRMKHEIPVLRRILYNAISDPAALPVICVIDAIDECRMQDQQRLIEFICDSIVGPTSSNMTAIKFLVTSRPDDNIRRRLEPLSQYAPLTWLRGETEDSQLQKEINSVIRHEIDSRAAEFALTSEYRESLCYAIAQPEQRTYLWWKLIRHYLWTKIEESRVCDHISIKSIVSQLPQSLEDTYEKLLQDLRPTVKHFAKATFEVMLATHRPITIAELARILENWPYTVRGVDSPVEINEKQLARNISTFCGLLITVSQSKLFFIHRTAREFLLHQDASSAIIQPCSSKWQHSISLSLAHYSMAFACYKLVYSAHRSITRPNLDKEQGILEYANRFVWTHMSEAVHLLDKHRGLFRIARMASFGMNLQVLDTQGMSLLHRLIVWGNPHVNYEAIAAVLHHGGLAQSTDRRNMHCLQYAVRQNDIRLIELLLRNGFRIDASVRRSRIEDCAECRDTHSLTASKGLTGLHAAALFGSASAMITLIQWGANVSLANEEGRTPLHMAICPSPPGRRRSDAWEDDEFMINHRWDYDDEQYCNDVQVRARMMRLYIVHKLCQKSAALVHVRDNGGRTALHLLRYDDPDIAATQTAKLLLSYGADPRATDSRGITPIHLAAKYASTQCLDLFVPPGREIYFSTIDNYGRTCLHFAAMSRYEQGVSYILGRFNTAHLIHAVDRHDQDPLHIALFDRASTKRRFAHDKIVSTLLAAGAKANRVNQQGHDALAHYLVHENFMDVGIIQQLLEHGSSISYRDGDGINLAHNFAKTERKVEIEALCLLQRYGTPVSATDNHGRNILHHAAIAGSISYSLLEHMCHCLRLDPSTGDNDGKSPLIYAKEQRNIERHKHFFRSGRWRDSEILLNNVEALGQCSWCEALP